MIITIDGPAASGKSTAARLLADALGFYYINSGLLYRSLAYLLINNAGYTLEMLTDPNLHDIAQLFDPARFSYQYHKHHGARILFDGQDITPFLKTSFIDKAASFVSGNENVREVIVALEHTITDENDSVIEGRDCGSIAFPYAQIKFFLTADLEIRARRWMIDQEKKGIKISFEQACEQLNARDERDINRQVSPLVVPQDAFFINNSEMTLEQTVKHMLDIIKKNKS